MRRLRVFVALAIGGVLALNSLPRLANAAQPMDDALARDAVEYSRMVGVSEAEALRRLQLQSVIGELSASLEAQQQGRFGGLFIEHEPDYRVVVLLTSLDGDVVSRYVAGTPLEGIVEVRSAEYSLTELLRDQEALDEKLSQPGVWIDLNIKANRLDVQVERGRDIGAISAADEALPPTARFITNVEPRTPALDLYGGLHLTTCTSGFTIYYGANQANRGITTAGHCPNAQSFNGVALTYQNDGVWAGDRDAQSHKKAGAVYKNWIRDDAAGGIRAIVAKRLWVNQNVGDFVCKYGKVTKAGCGFIVSKNAAGCAPVAGSLYVKVDSDPDGGGFDLAESGDSGGPWYTGSTALGNTSCQQGFDAIYTTVGFTEGALGAKILTVP